MNEEMKNLMWELHDLTISTLKHYDKDDDHWKITLSLVRYTSEQLLKIIREEE